MVIVMERMGVEVPTIRINVAGFVVGGISAVALSQDGTWECFGTRAGFLEGALQTVPRAELRALVECYSARKAKFLSGLIR